METTGFDLEDRQTAVSRREFIKTAMATATLGLFSFDAFAKTADKQPNILLAIADDWSWPHASVAGCKFVHTPNFDKVAREGALFRHAYVAAPTCTASRGALLTGQWMWRLEEGANLEGMLKPKFEVYPDLLERDGYKVGYTGKGWGPGDYIASGRTRNPAGTEYNHFHTKPPTTGISSRDYAANFEEFLRQRTKGRPFCFWYGGHEPHRPYEYGSGLRAGKNINDVQVPSCLPDSAEVRADLLDYALAIEYFDMHLGRMIQKLDEIGEFANTLIVVTGDNGLPFPRCKSNLYDTGTATPLAICWGDKVRTGRVVEDFISLCDLAPTFLDVAGLIPHAQMTGRSILPVLMSDKSGNIDPKRNHILTGIERHDPAQPAPSEAGYPIRAIRTHEFLYIRNFKPEFYPAGIEGRCGRDTLHRPGKAPPRLIPDSSWQPDSFWPFSNIDPGPTKQYMMDHRDDPEVKPLFALAVAKRPAEELYVLARDPGQLKNVADDPAYAKVKNKLSKRLLTELRETGDPRLLGGGDKFDEYSSELWKTPVWQAPWMTESG